MFTFFVYCLFNFLKVMEAEVVANIEISNVLEIWDKLCSFPFI